MTATTTDKLAHVRPGGRPRVPQWPAIGEAMAVVPSSATKTRPHGVTFVPLAGAPPVKLECISLATNPAPALAQFTRFLDHRSDALKAS